MESCVEIVCVDLEACFEVELVENCCWWLHWAECVLGVILLVVRYQDMLVERVKRARQAENEEAVAGKEVCEVQKAMQW